jgi:hypothetical protein
VSSSEVIVIVVPLVTNAAGEPDYSAVDAATASVAVGLQAGSLVIYETTLPVHTTRRKLAPSLAAHSGLRPGNDFMLCHSPKRVSSGTVFADLRRYPKLVGIDECSGKAAEAFYQSVLDFDERPDLAVSIRKSCERACRGPAWRLAAAMPVLWLFARVLSGGWRLRPGAEVFRAGVPGQEAFQRPAGERFPAVAAAFVQVGGEIGQDVEAGHPGGRGDGPDDGGVPGGVPVPGPAGVLPGHDRPADLPLRGIVVLMPISA